MDDVRSPAGLARALADPIRIAILEALFDGPATVAGLMASTGASQSNVSNHLAILRKAGLAHGLRQGRQVSYRLKDAVAAQLLEALLTVAGRTKKVPAAPAPLALARTCYDHLAGRLGVRILDAMLRQGVVTLDPKQGTMALGPGAEPVLAQLGIDLGEALKGRRRLVLGCADWTERRPHLGGSLGAALCNTAIAREWILPQSGTRAVVLTRKGKTAFGQRLGVRLENI